MGEYEDHKEMLFVQGVSQSSMLYLCRVETVRLAGGFALVDNILLVKLLLSRPIVSAQGNSVTGLCLNCPISALMSSSHSPPQRQLKKREPRMLPWLNALPLHPVSAQYGFGMFFKTQLLINVHDMINSSEGSDILVFNCYLWHVGYFVCFLCLQHQDR